MKFVLLIFALSSLFTSSAQEPSEDHLLFHSGNALYNLVHEELDLDSELKQLDTSSIEDKIKMEVLTEQKEEILAASLYYFEELVERFPESDLIFRAMNNAALILHQLSHTEDAIAYYKRIIDSEANDKEKGGIGEGIMAEPYALYKNRACKRLSEIYLEEEDFTSALIYIDLTKKHPYQHFCGNEYAANDLYIALLYTRCYRGMGKIDEALSYSLPHIFNSSLADNSRIVEVTIDILKEKYQKEELLAQLDHSIENFHSEKTRGKNNPWKRYYIDFLNTKIELGFLMFDYLNDEEAEKDIERESKRSYFYKLLKE